MFISHQFKAFDTDISAGIIIDENKKFPQALTNKIEAYAKDFENRFSRFSETSELNLLNNKKSGRIKASDEMIDMLSKAKTAYVKTNGLFDPTVLISLKNIGYDKSFSDPLIKLPSKKQISILEIKAGFKKRIVFDSLKIDKKHFTLSSPVGLSIDLGGIAKSYWVNTCRQIIDEYSENFWLSAGGDVYTKGKNSDGKQWKIGVQNPKEPESDILTLNLPTRAMGIATSGIIKRTIQNGTSSWHHIIDPRTGIPVNNAILAVTVMANSVIDADIMAKTILILGMEKGLALINGMSDHECVIIDKELKIHVSKGIKKFL